MLPTYNEASNLPDVTHSLFSLDLPTLNVIVVDDGSPDGTGQVAEHLATRLGGHLEVIHRDTKQGLGTAYCRGFQWALERDYDPIIQMDADLSHNPDDILRLIDASESYDGVIGSRYIEGVNVVNWPMRRLLLSYFANWYARVVIRLPIMDLTGGFKCIHRRVLKEIDFSKIRSEGYSFQIEMNFLACIKGFKLTEIPIVFTDRTVGESKMNRGIVLEAIWMVPKLLIKKIFRIH